MKKDSFMSTRWGYKDIITVCRSDLKEDMQELDRLRAEVKEKDELIQVQANQIAYQKKKRM